MDIVQSQSLLVFITGMFLPLLFPFIQWIIMSLKVSIPEPWSFKMVLEQWLQIQGQALRCGPGSWSSQMT